MATLTPRQRASYRNLSHAPAGLSTPGARRGGDEVEVGDTVEVPGGMDGTVKFVGEVRGKPGYFVGVELSRKYASRGKNDGDADGIRYFTTSVPGAGIFLPIQRAIKVASPTASAASVPDTPNTPSFDSFVIGEQDERTPPSSTYAPKFSQSVSGRPPSPTLRPKSRPSLPRPESPLRRAQQQQQFPPTTTPGASRPSLGMNRLKNSNYAASPTPAKVSAPKTPGKAPNFSSSVRGVRPPSRVDRAGDEDELARLRSVIQEKNDKIAQLSTEFDSHRADFRSTLDALEMASTETERVYEKKVADLTEECRILNEERTDLMAQGEDVVSVAQQLRQLEEVVQELEEGLEDARRGEAEARGEVEFLRGEVERVRAELRREREKNAALANGAAKDSQPQHPTVSTPKTPPRSRSIALQRDPSPQPPSPYVSKDQVGGDTPPPLRVHRNHEAHSSMTSNPMAASPPLIDLPEPVPAPESAVSPPPVPTVSSPLPAASAESPAPAALAPTPTPAVADEDKWCALCEQDGHDSISCPYDK